MSVSWPVGCRDVARERVIDSGTARELGKEPLEIRLRNVVRTEGQPARMITGRSLAGLTVDESLRRIAQMVDLPWHFGAASSRPGRAGAVYRHRRGVLTIDSPPVPGAETNLWAQADANASRRLTERRRC